MQYLSEFKDWKYHLKSGLVTFSSVFIPLTALEIYNAFGSHITQLKPEDITVASMVALFVALIRVIIVSLLKTLLTFVIKMKDRFRK